MPKKLQTIKVSGGEYAKVATRLKEFREANPRGSIKTKPLIQEDGAVVFEAFIKSDLSEIASAEATGHSYSATDAAGVKRDKLFEKLETIAVGRALANLGWLASGEIASFEEMQEFEAWKENKKSDRIDSAKSSLLRAKNIEALKIAWSNVDGEIKPLVEDYKNELKSKLESSVKKSETIKVRN